MRKSIISTIVTAVLISCTTEMDVSENPITSPNLVLNVSDKMNITDQNVLSQSRIKTERLFKTIGTPLVVPLLEESDPGLFLIPIATGDSLTVDALYLADATGTMFDINNLYPIKSVIYSPNDDEPYRLIVTDKDGGIKAFYIDSFICNLTGKYEKKWTDILSVYFFFVSLQANMAIWWLMPPDVRESGESPGLFLQL